MLILRRKEGQWVELTHHSGERIRFRVYNIRTRHPGQLDIAFDDPLRNFSIERPERRRSDAAHLPSQGELEWPTENPSVDPDLASGHPIAGVPHPVALDPSLSVSVSNTLG